MIVSMFQADMAPCKSMEYVIGIDVGSVSVRGAIVDKNGKILKKDTRAITTWNPKSDFYQQSSTEIWDACCHVIKNLIEDVSPQKIKGIGFDATCSVAVFDVYKNPVSVDTNGSSEQNVILWMDHRAKYEADYINSTKHPILKYVGGIVSPEMMIPKILWLKRNNLESYKNAEHFFLLPDFLSWKSTGNEIRSLCSLVCKCNYESSMKNSKWPIDYFESIDLAELANNNWAKIGSEVLNPGERCGKLSRKAATETGLLEGIPVATSLIDAHAGAVGLLACKADGIPQTLTSRLSLIMGTSTCHMWQTDEEFLIPGIWGPYYNALVPSYWLFEGGQSASGKLIDHVIDTHPATRQIREKIGDKKVSEYLNDVLYRRAEELSLKFVDQLTKNIHMWPDYHGNRSPMADPNLRGMVVGLTLMADEIDLALLYLATMQSLAYGTKHIMETLQKHSKKKIESVLICGGLSKNKVFVQTHANVLGKPVLIPDEIESVLLGSAIIAASGCGLYPSLETAMFHMAGAAKLVAANTDACISEFHAKKYAVFFELLDCQIRCQQLML